MILKSPYVRLTYKQLSDVFGISYDAALQRVRRKKKWIKSSDNQGRVIIQIPTDEYEKMSQRVSKNVSPDGSNDSPDTNSTFTIFKDISERLDMMAGENARLNKENGLLDASLSYEKEHSSQLSHALKQRDDTICELRDKLQKEQSRSWWRRLLGVP